jgi:hypothetical protein
MMHFEIATDLKSFHRFGDDVIIDDAERCDGFQAEAPGAS